MPLLDAGEIAAVKRLSADIGGEVAKKDVVVAFSLAEGNEDEADRMTAGACQRFPPTPFEDEGAGRSGAIKQTLFLGEKISDSAASQALALS